MTLGLGVAVIVASVLSFAQKWIGYQVPADVLERPRIARVLALVPVALLGALLATQGATADGTISLDSRLPALAVAGLLLWRRAPFLLVVVAAAVFAAGLRALGWP